MTMIAATETKRRGGRTVFTDEVLRAIPSWVSNGMNRHDIAKVLGTTTSSLENICSRRGISLNPAAYTDLGDGLRRGLGHELWSKLQSEARRRGVQPMRLAIDLLKAIARDGLFDAVIDDRQDPCGEPS